jgi:amino acid permease
VPFVMYVLIGGFFSYLGMYLISRLILKFKVDSYS